MFQFCIVSFFSIDHTVCTFTVSMKELNDLQTLIEYLNSRDIELIGYTEEEVANLEIHHDIQLPEVYRKYLRLMGKYSGPVRVGDDSTYDDLFQMKERAIELMKAEHHVNQLPQDAFVFYMYQGDQFLFFRGNEGSDPPVYGFHRSLKKEIQMVYPTFTDYLKRRFTFLDRTLDLKK